MEGERDQRGERWRDIEKDLLVYDVEAGEWRHASGGAGGKS